MRLRINILWLVAMVLVLGTASLSGCKSIKEICRSTCKQQRECDPNYADLDVSQCRAYCEDELSQYTEAVGDSCGDAYLEMAYCSAHLSCTDYSSGDYSDCEDEYQAWQAADCTPTRETDCYNGIDDDNDGLTDCNDSDCVNQCGQW